jgi:hypothetical protein
MPELPMYRSEAEIEEVVRRLEACECSPADFGHGQHLAVAAWYILKFGSSVATGKMRESLLRYTTFHGRHRYHETVTLFWLRAVELHVREMRGAKDSVEIVNAVVVALGDKSLISRHYSAERIASAEAKAHWTEPDLAPLPT